MAIEIIDGTLDPIEPHKTKRGYSQFNRLRIQTAGGAWREFPKVYTGPGMAEHLTEGGAGRFYFDKVDGPLGLYAVRRPDGRSYYAHYSNSEFIALIIGAIGTAGAIVRFGFGVPFPWLAAVIGPPLLAGWFYLRHRKQAAHQAFLADNA